MENEQDFDIAELLIKIILSENTIRGTILPHLDLSWFSLEREEVVKVIESVIEFNGKYSKPPTARELFVKFRGEESVTKLLDKCINIPDEEVINSDFILEVVKDFVKRKRTYNVLEDIREQVVNEGKAIDVSLQAEQLVDINGFSFDTNLGLDFLSAAEEIYDNYTISEKVYSTGIPTLDKLLNGGLPSKALTLLAAGTNVGKTMLMQAIALNLVKQGFNVLYISFEDDETKMARRLTQNMLGLTQEQIKLMERDKFIKLFNECATKMSSHLIVKEFPDASCSPMQAKFFIKELIEKKKFTPQIVFFDYIGCMIPNGRVASNLNENSIMKLVTGQVRGVGMEMDMAFVSGVQLNREGNKSNDPKITDVADSFAMQQKSDCTIVASQLETDIESGIITLKTIKTRYGANKGMYGQVRAITELQQIVEVDTNIARATFSFSGGSTETKVEEPKQTDNAWIEGDISKKNKTMSNDWS